MKVIATPLHVRARSPGTFASRAGVAIVALWFVTCGVLGRRHEAQIAHVLDPATGLVVHAQHLAGHHDPSKHSDVHGQDDAGDHDACALSAAIHQAAISTAAPVVARVTPVSFELDPPRACAARAAEIYRFAPKTSPPVA